MNRFSIRKKLLAFSLFILAGIGFMGYTAYKSNQTLFNSEQWVRHTEEVIYQSGNILSLGKDIESASRGFIITNDSSFLAPLYAAKENVRVYIEQLKRLTRDNPSQQKRIDSLNFYMQKRLYFSFKMAEIRSKQGLAPALAYVSTGQGKQYTGKLRDVTNAIQQEENTLLIQRNQTNRNSVVVFNRFSIATFVLILWLPFFY